MLLRILIAILIGVVVTMLLDYFGVFNHGIDVLLGLIAETLYFFGHRSLGL